MIAGVENEERVATLDCSGNGTGEFEARVSRDPNFCGDRRGDLISAQIAASNNPSKRERIRE